MTFIDIPQRWSSLRAQAGAHFRTHSYTTHIHTLCTKFLLRAAAFITLATAGRFILLHDIKRNLHVSIHINTHTHIYKSLCVTKLRHFVHELYGFILYSCACTFYFVYFWVFLQLRKLGKCFGCKTPWILSHVPCSVFQTNYWHMSFCQHTYTCITIKLVLGVLCFAILMIVYSQMSS